MNEFTEQEIKLLDAKVNEVVNQTSTFWWGTFVGIEYGKVSICRCGSKDEPDPENNSYRTYVKVKYKYRDVAGKVFKRYDKSIKINDAVWHACNMDIIEYRVKSITEYDNFIHYNLISKYPVGACGVIEVIVSENNGKLRFVELIDEDEIEHSSGLGDFVEGFYYTDFKEARLEHLDQQRLLSYTSMEKNRRLYEQSKKNYGRVEKLVKELKLSIKQN